MIVKQLGVEATVEFKFADQVAYDDAIGRVTGPEGDEWRASLYDLHTEEDVLDHWAYNAVANGVTDVNQLDGWADIQRGKVTMNTIRFEAIR